jgi:hypothetical protein
MKQDSLGFSVERKLGNAVIGCEMAYLRDGTSLLMRNLCYIEHLAY